MNNFHSYAELDEIGDALVRRYYPQKEYPPECVDVEGLAVDYLGLPVVYISFAEDDPDKIGFISDGRTPLRVYENGKAISRIFDKGTIVIEKALLSPKESGRRRFTIAHEIAHYLIDNSLETACFNRVFDAERIYSAKELRAFMTVGETQVDRLGAAILMPVSSTRMNVQRLSGSDYISIYGHNVIDHEERLLIRKLANTMGASVSAMTNRLRDLSLFEQRPIDEYVDKMVGKLGDTR